MNHGLTSLPRGGGSSSILTSAPVVIPPATPNADLSTAAIHSSLDKTTGGGDHLSKAGLSDPDAPTVSPLAATTLSGALVVGGPGVANASERPSAGGSKKRKRMFAFEDPESPSLTPEDCARYLHSFRLSSSSLPDLEDMSFVQEYIEWASCEAQSKIKGNHLVGLFEGKCMRLSDDLEEERCLLAEERERLSAALLSLKTSEENSIKLEAESRDLRAESVVLRKMSPSGTIVRKYLSDRNVVHPQILIESQLSGVVSCLKLFIEEGIPIPAAKLAENKQALSVHTTALNQMEVNDLEMSDLPSFSFDVIVWLSFLLTVGDFLLLWNLRHLFVPEAGLVFVRARPRLRCRVGIFKPFTESVFSLGGGRDSARLIPCKVGPR
ncbi:hypothetical protein DY000_02030147 [Brassica cretica]|uniref:Uncharacterized protein n=1 Tax=Brassica cretica TaxID=69181 RepID=A0ABQ7DLK2_BRACR|nr:hypothetical protein DY000_02030147 [Brassica cretica]